jgi:hypothetical protein
MVVGVANRKAAVVTSPATEIPSGEAGPARVSRDAKLSVVNPTVEQYGGEADDKQTDISPRLDTLSGKTIGLLWNAKPFGDVALQTVKETLQATYDDVEFRFYSGSQPHPPKLLEKANEECDAIIACTAD